MLKQAQFESAHRSQWLKLRATVDALASPNPRKRPDKDNLLLLPELYVIVCNHLSLAKTRGYSPNLINELHTLVLDSHRYMYQHKTSWFRRAVNFVKSGFPALVRQHYKLFWLSSAFFYIPAILTGLFAFHDNDFIYRIHDAGTIHSMEAMYDPSNSLQLRPQGRESSSDFQMFGYYISNNISIDFRVFAGGMLFGIGSIFFLLYNGLFIGSVAGHLTAKGYIETFWGFVAGHSAFELTALVISGMSGLIIGLALIKPGRLSRTDALKKQSQIAVRLVIGAGIMTLFAAFIEAYWSSGIWPPAIKYSVGITLWILTFVYLRFGGIKSNTSNFSQHQDRHES